MRLRFEIYFSYYREKRFSSVNHTTKTIHHHKSRNCIDLISTISSRSFFSTETCFEGLSDCHKIVLSTFKTIFFKTGTKEMMYRDFKNFDQEIFSQELRTSLSANSVLE